MPFLAVKQWGVGLALAAAVLVGCDQSGDVAAPVTDPDSVIIVGKLGRQPGQFSKPRAVAFSRSGLLFIIDRTGRLLVHDGKTGAFVRQWWLPRYDNGTPTGISIDPIDDSLWVANTHYGEVLRYDQEGNIIQRFGESGEEEGHFVFVTDVCPDPDGKTLWITEYGRRNRVMQFTRDGQFLREWGPKLFDNDDLERPMAVQLAPDGQSIFVVDTGNCRINRYDRDGKLIAQFGQPGSRAGDLNMPQDLAIGPDGLLYVVEYSNCRVSRFTLEGEFVDTWARSGNGVGELFTPWGIAVSPTGEMVIADTMNHRLQLVPDVSKLPWSSVSQIASPALTPVESAQ